MNKIYFNGILNSNRFKQKDGQPDMIGDLELPLDFCENIHKQYLLYKDHITSNSDPKPKISIAGWVNLSKPKDDGSKQPKYITVRASDHKDRKDGEQTIPRKPAKPTTTMDDMWPRR